MEQLGERTPKSPPSTGLTVWLPFCLLAMLSGMWLVGLFWLAPFKNWSPDFRYGVVTFVVIGFTAMFVNILLTGRLADRSQREETQARQRVRQAEDKLGDALRVPWVPADEVIQQLDDVLAEVAEKRANGAYADKVPGEVQAPGTYRRDLGTLDPEIVEQIARDRTRERKDERLTLAALWDVTHGRMDLYHQIVTRQARRSFGAAQVAMGIGFVLLVVFAILAAEAKTTTAAVSAGGLGAVGAAFAAYIGKTFIRSQESAASHLRAYFDQPLELSRYLAAERLLADAADLTAEQRAAIVSSLVQSIATAGRQDGNAKETKPTARQPKGRAPR
jgi:hypothetical protein